jgi:hypothetical protein
VSMKVIVSCLLLLVPLFLGTAHATPASTDVVVSFEGMIVHVLGGGVTRAIVPRLSGHQMTLTLPGSAKEDVERVFAPLRCPTVCDVPIDGVAFRIVDGEGRASAAPFVPNADFDAIVTKLSAIPSPHKPFEKKEDLVPEIFADAPVANGIVAGYFELAGGTGTVEAFACGGRFAGQTGYSAFPSKVDVLYRMQGGARLQVRKAGSDTWEEIALGGPIVKLAVRNDIPDSRMSHFDMYALLSTKRVDGRIVDLPEITTDGRNCVAPAGGIPGCSESSWP